MTESIEIKLDNKEVESKLLSLKTKRKPATVNEKHRRDFRIFNRRKFQRTRSPKWEKLKDSTIKQRTKNKQWLGMILQISGQLASSVNTYYDNDQTGIDSNLDYAAIQQLGIQAGKNKSVEIPARPYLKLTDDDFEEIIAATQKFLL